MQIKRIVTVGALIAALFIVGCGQAAPAATAVPVVSETSTEPAPPAVAGEQPADGAVETAVPAESAVPIQPIPVTYVTPAQQEGPYYTVEKPADRDNDLTVVPGATAAPAGEVIEFGGRLYDAAGMPVAGAVLEIWQTDASGVYLHPNDPNTDRRDRNFQFYGEATTAEDGRYAFRTILPGLYEPRPRHIHVKVKLDGRELLTTQFYFAGEGAGAPEPLLISLAPGVDAAGQPVLVGERDVVLGVALSGG